MRRFSALLAAFLLVFGALPVVAQQVTLAGLRAENHAGAFHGLRQDAAGNLYTLFEAQAGIHLQKYNAAGTQLLAETLLGQSGDSGIALDLDPAGNIYIAGTSNSLGSVSGTAGTAFPTRAGTRTNSFVAKFSPQLQTQWITFCGAEPLAVSSIAATANSVLVTGSIFSSTLPVTSNGIQQSPAPNSGSNGFVESFVPASGALQYATYLSGANGDTTPAAITADSTGRAFIAGTTTATGFPTTAALVPVFRSVSGSNTSGFVTELTAAGDGFLFSTFVPGNGLTSAAYDASSGTLLLSGDIAPGLFPVTDVQVPIAPLLRYQTAVRLAADGSTVQSSTLLAPGTNSVVAPGASGSMWTFGSVQNTAAVPLLPVLPVETLGNAYALRVNAAGKVDRAARFGGLPLANSGYSSLPAQESGVVALADGTVALSGSVTPTLSSDLLATETYNLALASAPNTALPSTVRDALPASDCTGSACSGSAALLARLLPEASAPTLALSVDDQPNLTLRNLGTATATSVQITASGFTVNNGCGPSLAPAAECSVALTGNGPGLITVQAANAAAFTTQLAATARSLRAVSAFPREVDFGIVTATSSSATRVLTITNLGTATETFASQNSSALQAGYTLSEAASTCTPSGSGTSKVLAPGGTCTVTLTLQASSSSATDGAVNAHWQIGTEDVLVTGYVQAASTTVSASTIDFGRQFSGGLRSSRYLYLSNASDRTVAHNSVAGATPAFTVSDECPATLQPRSICRIALDYQASTSTSSDAATLNVDGMQVAVLGETLPQPSATGTSANPNLRLTSTSVTFTNAVNVTQSSSETHAVTVSNAGTLPLALSLATSGDFAFSSGCPAMLNGGASCTVVLSFTPTAPGVRQGLLSVTAGFSSPSYVALSGTGTAILPAGSGNLSFGDVPLGSPAVQWLKVAQSFALLTVSSSDTNFAVVLVEDTGFGHGQPPASAFGSTASGSCTNCYLGVQFLPLGTGAHTGTATVSSPGSGKPTTLALMGSGIPLTGLILTPVSQDFGTVPVHSSAASTRFILTNGTASAITTTAASTTGDFSVTTESTGAAACSATTIAPGAACLLPIKFTPSATGVRAGSLTITSSAGQVTSMLSGTGSDDPGVSFTPGELRFDNVPGTESTQRTIRVTNTSTAAISLGTPTSSDAHFTAATACGSLAPSAGCDITVTYSAGNFLASGTVSIPVTSAPAGAPSTTTYAIAVSGVYTSDNAGIQIVPGEYSTVNFGSAATGSPALKRVLHVNNLATQALTLNVTMPRQFALTDSTCTVLAAGAGCDLTVQYTPLTAADTTGTVFVQGTPADGSAVRSGLGYLQAYGTGTGAFLAIAGDIAPNGVLNFGQIASGSSAQRTVTITNPVSSPAGTSVTVRRVSSGFPFLSTTTCGAALAPGQSCAVTVTYSPLYQAAIGSSQTGTQADTGVLQIESDSSIAPQFVDLSGTATPAFVSSPSNTAPVAALTTLQGSLTFTSTAVGTASAAQTVTVQNTGTATLHVQGLVTSNGFSASSTCATLVAGASCSIVVQYNPQNSATALGSLEIQSDASASLEFVSLLGNVVESQTPVASLSLTPQSLDFGRVLVGGSSMLLATLTNTGSVPVVLGARSVSGDSSFSLSATSTSSNPCGDAGATLAAGAACTVSVTFTPAATGTLRGTLSIASSATAQPLTVALSGVGTQPQLVASPTAIAFGDVAVGSTSTQAFTLVNTSTTAVDGLRFTATTGFSISSTCGITTVQAGSSCAVNVTYAPSTAGITNGVLTVFSTDPASPLTVPLSGNGLQARGVAVTNLSATPSSLDFGNVTVGSNSTLSFTLSNPTATTANGLLFNASTGFSVSSSCGTSLNAYSTCPVVVTFSPTVAGTATGTVTVQNSSSTSPLTVALTGNGSNVQAQLKATPNAVSFGSVPVGSSSTLPVTLANTGSTAINSIAITASSGFATGGTCTANLNAGSSCDVLVTYSPTTAGAAAGTLTIRSSDAASQLTLALSGTGTVLPPQLALTPNTLNFGNVAVGSSTTLATTLLNTSSTAVTNIGISASTGFTVNSSCGAALAPGSSCPIRVTFTPAAAGVQTGTLTVNSSDSTSPLIASLTGAGVGPASTGGSFTLTVNGASAASATVQTGLPTNFSLLVTPVGGFTGTVALTCTADSSVAYAACSLVPSSVTLNGSAQSSTATVSTVSAVSLASAGTSEPRIRTLWCLTPALLVLLLRRKRPAALLVLLAGMVTLTNGCGSGGDPRIRYVAPGSYTFHVTATSTSGATVAQTVTLSLTVTPR